MNAHQYCRIKRKIKKCIEEKARNIRSLSCDRDRVGVCGLSVDESTLSPVKTDMHRVVATLPSASTHSQIGKLFGAVLNIFTNSGINFQLLFNNPSTQTMYLDKIIFGSIVFPREIPQNYLESVLIRIRKNATIVDSGEPGVVVNLNTAFPDASSVVLTQNPTVTGGFTIFNVRTLGYASIDFDGRIVVAPQTNLVVEHLFDDFPLDHSVNFRSTIIWYEL